MQESFLKKCQANFLFSAKLKQVFKKKKNTLMLFSCQNSTGEKLEKVGLWMLGATIGMKKKQCQLIDDNGVKTQEIFLTQKHSIHIHENDKNRVVGIDLLKFEEESNLPNLLITLALIQKISSGSQMKIYALVNPSNDNYKSIIQQLKLKFSTLSFIEWVWNPEDADQDKDGNLSIIKNNGENSKGPASIEKLNSNGAINGFGKYISLKMQPVQQKGGKQKQNTYIKSVQNTRANLTKYIFSFIKPLTKIFEQVYLGNDFENNQLNQLLVNQMSQIKKFVDGQRQLKNLKNLIEIPHIKKMDEHFAWKNYTMSYIMLRQQSEEKQKKKVDPSIELFKDFVRKLYQNLIYTPIMISEENIRYFNVILNLVAEQFQLLELISQKYCGFQVQEVYLVLNLKYKNQEIKLIEIQEKIAENVVKVKLKSNKSSDYYISISQLLENSFSNKLNIDKLANKDEIKKNLKQIQQKLPMLRTIAVIQNPYQQPAEVIKAIKYFFEIHFNISNQLKFSSNSLFKIFKGIGRSLRDFGLPQLALEVYKKLKFQNLIERCVNDIIIKQKLNEQKQGSELLFNTGRYFYINGNTAKAARFTQLAYQNCPDISYMKYMLKFKNHNMNSSIQGDELELLTKLTKLTEKDGADDADEADDSDDFNSYFNYEFDQSFKSSISSLQQLVENQQVNLDVVVTQEELSKFSFFSQALTEDD